MTQRSRTCTERLIAATAALTAAAAAPVALAHPGPRVWLSAGGQQVTTYAGSYPPGDPSAYVRSRIFTQAMTDQGDDFFDSEFPGFQIVPGGTIATGAQFTYSIAGPLLFYNPGDATHAPKYQTVASRFGAASAPQMAVNNELFQFTQTGPGPVPGHLAFQYSGSAGDHNHLTYTLLGNGVEAGGGADGVYALPLTLAASTAGVARSDVYWLLLGKRATPTTLAAAMALGRSTLLLPGDTDADGRVTFQDLQRLELGFGKMDAYPIDGDVNFDGVVNRADFRIILDQQGESLTGHALPAGGVAGGLPAVPEPGGVAVGTIVALGAMLRRRRQRVSDGTATVCATAGSRVREAV